MRNTSITKRGITKEILQALYDRNIKFQTTCTLVLATLNMIRDDMNMHKYITIT